MRLSLRKGRIKVRDKKLAKKMNLQIILWQQERFEVALGPSGDRWDVNRHIGPLGTLFLWKKLLTRKHMSLRLTRSLALRDVHK